jgi:hypothetical protein
MLKLRRRNAASPLRCMQLQSAARRRLASAGPPPSWKRRPRRNARNGLVGSAAGLNEWPLSMAEGAVMTSGLHAACRTATPRPTRAEIRRRTGRPSGAGASFWGLDKKLVGVQRVSSELPKNQPRLGTVSITPVWVPVTTEKSAHASYDAGHFGRAPWLDGMPRRTRCMTLGSV